ncbi:MAG: efflux RND transporter periplasmic adaptor subunit [Treponema sp.]|nr:efflux RND transporter periplasmic adaptor subunit [Treponema sp.]
MRTKITLSGRVPASFARRDAALLLALAVFAGFGSCTRRPAVVPSFPVAVLTATVARGPFSVVEEHSARIAARREVDISSKVGGRVQAVLADIGSRVRAGQTLFTIESGDYEARYRQAQAALQSANASLTRTSEAGQEQQIIQAQAAADAAQVAFTDAAGLYAKTKRLYDAGAIPKQQLDDVDARCKSAEIQRDSARKSLALVKEKSGPQSDAVAEAQVNEAKARLELAASQLEATTVRSPIDGLVSYRNVEAGEMTGPSTPAFIVIDESSLLAETGVSDRVVGLLRTGMKIRVSVDTLAGAPLEGVVDSISPAADPRTLLYRVRVLLRGEGLRPGMLARLRIPVETRSEALLVPESAAFSVDGADSVYVVENGAAKLRRITLGASDGRSVEVLGGLSAGETVVIAGQDFLNDGEKVDARRTAPIEKL